jgi:Na+-driven multidrug efflux pump
MNKLLSGRYIMVLAFTGAYCFTVVLSIVSVLVGRMSVEVFMGIFSAFSMLVGIIVKSYFERTDRDREKKEAADAGKD